MSTSRFDKKASDHVPWADDQGHDHLVGSNELKHLQSKQITQSGVAPLVVNFAAEGMENMKDTNYVVIVQGETAARVTVDQSTIATTGFNVLGGADTEVVHVLVIGRCATNPTAG